MSVDLGGAVLIQRGEWGARAPRQRQSLVPSFGTTCHWEGPHMGSFGHDQCASRVRSIQNYHMDRQRWQDIAYTALVCPHGFVFEGRWVGQRTAANGTSAGNSTAYAVCYLGGIDDPFTEEAQRALRVVLDFLDGPGGAGPGRNCHRDWKATQCPGDTICAWVRAGQPSVPGSPAPTPAPSGGPPTYPGLVKLWDGYGDSPAGNRLFKRPAVRVWQTRFRDVGYGLIVDGLFGYATNHIVWHFQTTHGLRPDALAGPATWHVLWHGV